MPYSMKFRLSIALCLFLSIATYSADSTKYITSFKFAPGLSVHNGLDEINLTFDSNGVHSINPISFSTLIQGRIQRGKSSYQLNLSICSLNNGSKLPLTQVNYNRYLFTLNYGTDILLNRPRLRLEPFIGFGASFGDFFIFTEDSIQTFDQAIGGAQNIFYEQSKPTFIGEAGIRLEFGNQANRIGYYAEFNTSHQFSDWNWKVNDMPLRRMTSLRFNLGFRFKLF